MAEKTIVVTIHPDKGDSRPSLGWKLRLGILCPDSQERVLPDPDQQEFSNATYAMIKSRRVLHGSDEKILKPRNQKMLLELFGAGGVDYATWTNRNLFLYVGSQSTGGNSHWQERITEIILRHGHFEPCIIWINDSSVYETDGFRRFWDGEKLITLEEREAVRAKEAEQAAIADASTRRRELIRSLIETVLDACVSPRANDGCDDVDEPEEDKLVLKPNWYWCNCSIKEFLTTDDAEKED